MIYNTSLLKVMDGILKIMHRIYIVEGTESIAQE
jgi:hypothetical protein